MHVYKQAAVRKLGTPGINGFVVPLYNKFQVNSFVRVPANKFIDFFRYSISQLSHANEFDDDLK